MEYLTPLIYRKILNTITQIYHNSAKDPEWDLFRFKDVLDSFSEGQIINKAWAVEELNKFITDDYDACLVIGSWHGLFSHMLAESGFDKKIVNVDLDPICNIIAKQLKVYDNIRFKDNDGIDLFPKFNYDNKIVICTACEHIDNEELDFMIRQKKPKLLMCLQSNNYYEVDSHINCSDTLEDFIASLPLKKILYAGKKNYKNKYDRFMVIGK